MTGPLVGAETLAARLDAISALLERAGARLAANPFFDPDPAWLGEAPALAELLLGLDDAEVDALELDPAALRRRLAPADPLQGSIEPLASVGRWPVPGAAGDIPEPPHVPGRKWAQVLAFSNALPAWPGPFVDWCAGKGHLGRRLAERSGSSARCIERSRTLCDDGAALAAATPVRFECRDVIADPPALHTDEQLTALHACGHLHDALVAGSIDAGIRAVALAPCCYHLGSARGEPWRPASRRGPATPLPDDLVRLAVRETVTAPAHVRRQRRTERAFRLGFDALRRTLEPDRPAYRSLPSVPKRLLGEGFAAFCAEGAAQLGLTLPPGIDFERWYEEGGRADDRARRLELARSPFRRLLELRMVLDRALWLAEAGYEVGVGEFCARALTPRNLLILAERSVSSPTGRGSG